MLDDGCSQKRHWYRHLEKLKIDRTYFLLLRTFPFDDARNGCDSLQRVANISWIINAEWQSWTYSFLFLHVRLFYFVFWKLTQSQNVEAFIYGFNIFMIVHLGLHILFLKHKNNEFKDWISWSIIIGAGLCGLIDLVMYGLEY